jgi:hypothetical protein
VKLKPTRTKLLVMATGDQAVFSLKSVPRLLIDE